MDRIHRICAHPDWQAQMAEIRRAEETREFCGHGPEHLLDVARIAYIEALERGLPLSKDLIYAAALLHDLGRAAQYRDGTPHQEAGAAWARRILPACGFSPEETERVAQAILGHREAASRAGDALGALLCRADKRSRLCLWCPAAPACHWDEEKKNQTIDI